MIIDTYVFDQWSMKIRKKGKVDLCKREFLDMPPGKMLNNRAPRRINMTDKKKAQFGGQRLARERGHKKKKEMSAPLSTMHNSCNVQADRRHCFTGNFQVWHEQSTTVEQLSDRLLPRTEGSWDFWHNYRSEIPFFHVSQYVSKLQKNTYILLIHLKFVFLK